MKTYIAILGLLASLPLCSQPKQIDKIRISAARVAKATEVSALIPDTLGACSITSYHFYANLGNTVKSMDVKNGEIAETIKTIVSALKPGEKFVIENIQYNCKEERKKGYVFIIQ